MVVIFAFSSYMLADSFGLSGIVAILFCGLVCCLMHAPFKALLHPHTQFSTRTVQQWCPAYHSVLILKLSTR